MEQLSKAGAVVSLSTDNYIKVALIQLTAPWPNR